ncbi:hypothetical protein AB205_0025550, partial [Aquarana catesbeiana]
FFAVSLIQIRWKGLRDCFKRYLRKISEARSGSGSKRLVPYVHADELDFLRPHIELRETQSSWEVGEEGQEAPLEPQGSQDQHEMAELPAPELDPSETSVNTPVTAGPSRVESPGPTQVRLRNSRPAGRHSQNMDRFANLVDRLNQKLDDLESEEHGFGIMVAGMLKKIPEERRNQVKKAVMDLLDASVRNEQPNCSSAMFGPPPPSGPYYPHSNPPPPRTHPYYSPRFHPYSDEYGNVLPYSHPPIPYPSPSPITSTIGAPSFTPSPGPSTRNANPQSEYQPSYHHL